MSSELNHLPSLSDPWLLISQELSACKKVQEQTWGDLDDTTLGRYLAGEVTGEEFAAVQSALGELPELRKLTDLVRDVLGEASPVPDLSPAPAILPLPAARRKRRVIPVLRRYAALASAACLLIVLGVAAPRSAPLAALSPNEQLQAGEAYSSRRPPFGSADKEGIILASASKTLPRRIDVMRFQREGASLLAQGELTAAEAPLAAAHDYCDKKLGRDHPDTRRTVVELAGMYQIALNAEPTQASFAVTARGSTPSPAMKLGQRHCRQRLADNAIQLQRCISTRSVAEVRASVVPVLVHGLCVANTEADRRALVRALGQLGPAARTALPYLADRLKSSTDIGEVHEILLTLGKMGPAAREAIPVLQRLAAHSGAGDKKAKPHGWTERFYRGALPARDQKLAADLLVRLEGREGRVGVRDEAGCFSVRVVRESCQALRTLACVRDLEVVIETRRCPQERIDCRSRLAGLGPRAILVILDPSSQEAQVTVSEALRREAFPAEQLREQLVDCCRDRQPDSALVKTVQLVSNFGVNKDP